MHKAWWVTQLDRRQFVDQLRHNVKLDTGSMYSLLQVSGKLVSIWVDNSVFKLIDPRDQLQLSYSESPDAPVNRWVLKKVPLHVAKLLPIATYIDVGNNMIRVFEEISEFTRRY